MAQQFPFPADLGGGRPHHRTVDRIAAILEHVARQPRPQGLSEIAKAVGAPVSSTQSLVNGLVAAGFLTDDGRAFSLGLAPYLLSSLAGRQPVDRVDHQILEDIVAETGYIAVHAVLVGGNVYYLDYAAADPSFEYLAQNRLRRSPLETSAGWVLLAGMPDDQLWGFLADLDPEEERLNAFQRAFPTIRETGECVAPKAAHNGADGVAVAVRSTQATPRVEAAVSVIATEDEIEADAQHIIEVLRRHEPRWN